MLEGLQDELYIKVWHPSRAGAVIIKQVPLGKFSPDTEVPVYSEIFDQELEGIQQLHVDIYDTDQLSQDDFLGGFILTPYNELQLKENTVCFPPQRNELHHFILKGNNSHYEFDAHYAAR